MKNVISVIRNFRDTKPKQPFNFDKNLNDFIKDDEKKTFTVFFRTKKFQPFSVYKTFLKMALSVLPLPDLQANSHYLEFLNSETPIQNGMQVYMGTRYVLKTKFYPKPSLCLYKAKNIAIDNKQYPEYIAVIYFANVVWQIFLPISIKNIEAHVSEQKLDLQIYPAFALEDLGYLNHISQMYQNKDVNPDKVEKIEITHLDLDITEKNSITDKIVLHYGEEPLH